MAEGTIMKALSGFYYVDDGASVYTCRGRGRLRHIKMTPLVGDRVRFTPSLDGSPGTLDEILPRRNEFFRPAVANIDQLVIIASEAVPVTDPFLIGWPPSPRAGTASVSSASINATLQMARNWLEFIKGLAFQPFASARKPGRDWRSFAV